MSPYMHMVALWFSPSTSTCISMAFSLSSFLPFLFLSPTSPPIAQTWKHQAALMGTGVREEFACLSL